MNTQPPRPPYEVANIDDIPPTVQQPGKYDFQLVGRWVQVRQYFAIREFSSNAFISTEASQQIIHEHVEEPNDESTDYGDEELYFVHRGTASVRLNDEVVDVGPGTLIFVGDPDVVRSITAKEADTVVIAFGTNPGVEFIESEFEREMTPPRRWSMPEP